MTAAWNDTRERSNASALRMMRWIAVFMGRRAARWALHPITLYFLCFSTASRRHSARYLVRALGRKVTWRDQYLHFYRFAEAVLDRVYFLRNEAEDKGIHLQVQGDEVVRSALRQGRGAFLVGAHIGSFEAIHTAGKRQPGVKIALIMYTENARMINAALEALAPGFKMNAIELGRRGSMLAVRDWLDQGGLAGLLADRSLPHESNRSEVVRVPFLGREAAFHDGAFRLAMLLRREVIFMVGLAQGGSSYDVRFEVLADFSTHPEKRFGASSTDAIDPEQQIREAVERYAARLEALCRESPFNWFNFYDFWDET